MTRDQIRGLIGGYATGTLTEAERKLLFEAALEDQELFDELAREQALKEAIDEPGAKARLIRSLEPAQASKPWWLQAWVWGASAAACVVLITGIVLLRSTVKVEEVAKLEVPVTPPINPPAPAPAPPSATLPAPQASPAPPVENNFSPALKKEEQAEPIPQPAAKAETGAGADQLAVAAPAQQLQAAAPAPVPAPTPAPPGVVQGFAANGTVGGLAAPMPAVPPQPPPAAVREAPAGGGGGRGGGRGGAARALAQPQAAKVAAPRFAFDYSISPENVLRVVPHANGFLSVYVAPDNAAQPVLRGQGMQAEMPAQVQLPADAVAVTIFFSAQPTVAAASGTGDSPDSLSGTKSDPNPSPNSVLVAQIALRR